ncbi:MAG TPA: hypothetical protein VK988_10950 [Acidimicrobiales bacterium]|nr:hypothetical protein [Acidimicrobiales bacterium]
MSARDKAVALAGEADRDWNTSEILAEWERRGDPIRGANPDNSLRAALSVAFQQGQLFRTAPGRYKSTKFKTDPGSLPLNGQNAQPESEGVVYEMNQPLG